MAVSVGSISVARVLLEASASTIESLLIATPAEIDESTIIAIVKLLIKHSANVCEGKGDECTALRAASLNGKEQVARFLLENGADPRGEVVYPATRNFMQLCKDYYRPREGNAPLSEQWACVQKWE